MTTNATPDKTNHEEQGPVISGPNSVPNTTTTTITHQRSTHPTTDKKPKPLTNHRTPY